MILSYELLLLLHVHLTCGADTDSRVTCSTKLGVLNAHTYTTFSLDSRIIVDSINGGDKHWKVIFIAMILCVGMLSA